MMANSTEDNSDQPKNQKRPLRRPQISLLTILLLIAAIAFWLAWYRSGQELAKLNAELVNMKKFARELVVENPNQYSVVSPHKTKFGENTWEIFIPKGAESKLNVTMGDVDDPQGIEPLKLDAPDQSVPLSSGQHTLELIYLAGRKKGTESVLTVELDGQEVIRQARSYDWESRSGSSGGNKISELRSFATDEPLLLFHRRFQTDAKVPPKLRPGIKLWISSAKESDE